MIRYAQLKPGPGFQAKRALGYYSQRLVTLPAVRRAIALAIAAGLKPHQGDGDLDPDSLRTLDELRRHGIAMLPPLVPAGAIERIASYFETKEVVGPKGRLVPLDGLPSGTSAAAYPLDTILNCPDIPAIVNHPAILGIAARHIGCKPTLSSLGARWSFPSDEANDTQKFHRDLDDWRILKLFIYLTDVDENSGPHVFVRSSHNSSWGLKGRNYTTKEIEDRFGAVNLQTVVGERGTTFMADTSGVHCGSLPVDRPRLILQAQYSLLPIYAFDYEPVESANPWGDAYINRLLMRH